MTPAIIAIVFGLFVIGCGVGTMIFTKSTGAGLIVMCLGVAPVLIGYQQHHDAQVAAAPTTTIISGPFAEALPCMDGSSGDCITSEERADRARMVAKALKEAGGAGKLRDMVCASSLTMLICVEVTPETNPEIIE